MVDFFKDPEERSGGNMKRGHHRVRVSSIHPEKGEPTIYDKPGGPRLIVILTDLDDPSQSCADGVTFNANTSGPVAGMNKCFGFTAAQMNELVTSEGDIGPTSFDRAAIIKIASMWNEAEGWIEVKPRPKDPDLDKVAYYGNEPKKKKGEADYAGAVNTGGI